MVNQVKQTYIFKASYPSTCKVIKVEAVDEDQAWDNAYKNRMVKGCVKLGLLEVR